MSEADAQIASRAALELGIVLDILRDDLAGARNCLRFAQVHGTGATRDRATLNLALLLATSASEKPRLRAFVREHGSRRRSRPDLRLREARNVELTASFLQLRRHGALPVASVTPQTNLRAAHGLTCCGR
jgi:hypothetical protein